MASERPELRNPFCYRCGVVNVGGAATCPRCGAPLGGPFAPTTAPPPPTGESVTRPVPPPLPAGPRRKLRLPTYSLRTLFLVMTLVCLWAALTAREPIIGGIVAIVALTVVVYRIAG